MKVNLIYRKNKEAAGLSDLKVINPKTLVQKYDLF